MNVLDPLLAQAPFVERRHQRRRGDLFQLLAGLRLQVGHWLFPLQSRVSACDAFQMHQAWSGALHGAVRLDVKRVERMSARHVETVVLWAAEAQVPAPLGQPNKADGLTLRVEHLY